MNGREHLQVEELPEGEWALDPTDHALKVSHGREKLVHPLCAEIGRRLLLAEMQFNRWTVRRVEKVSFDEDRNVTRRITVDFNVRDDAPVVTDGLNNKFWIVPVSLMRRRTLVNMRISDENGHVLPTPGIRLTQQLDESLLLAAVSTVIPVADEGVLCFIRELVAGEKKESKLALAAFEGKTGKEMPQLRTLFQDPLVRAVVYLLSKNFSLYVFLPVDSEIGKSTRHRLLNLEFNEPTGWSRMTPLLEGRNHLTIYNHDDRPVFKRRHLLRTTHNGRPAAVGAEPPDAVSDDGSELRSSDRLKWYLRQARRKICVSVPAAFGLKPTRIRLQVPGAENAASYHLELTAPAGVEVVRARLLAGRPNEGERKYTNDRIVGHTATVGLHGVEIPNGSLCLAQVDFRVTSRGWLTNAVFSCAVVAGGLLWLAILASGHKETWSTAQVTNIIAVLITTAAAVAATIAHTAFTGVAARMVARLRLLAAVAVAQPLIAAAALAFAFERDEKGGSTPMVVLHPGTLGVLWGNMYVALGVCLLIGWALTLSLMCERKGSKMASPWDMTTDDAWQEEEPKNFIDALELYGFTGTAIAILSAESWHERYAWTDEKHKSALRALYTRKTSPASSPFTCTGQQTGCSIQHTCPYKNGRKEPKPA